MITFYDHPKTGAVHFRASAGGAGSGITGVFDCPATAEHIRRNPNEYDAYLRMKANGSEENRKNKTDMAAKDLYIQQLETALGKATAEIERLNGLLAGGGA